ncbi:MAG: hypothetical protein Q9167_006572 [Letrouitia subvulpina]
MMLQLCLESKLHSDRKLSWVTAFLARRHYHIIRHEIKHQWSQLPTVKVDFKPPPPKYNGTKVALMIEDRPIKHMAALVLHMLIVIPPEWSLLFLGSGENLAMINTSIGIQSYQAIDKLEVRQMTRNESFSATEQRNRMLTDISFYEHYVPSAEWLLIFSPDSILCANSKKDLNDWLTYDWVGAPWYPNAGGAGWSGGGGLSLRRVSRIKQVLQFQTRLDDGASEDKWLNDRIKVLPDINLPKPEIEKQFTVEGVWHERPMGFHLPTRNKGLLKSVWENRDQRKQIFEYCPEIKIIMEMKLERERCQEQNESEENKNEGH